MGEATSMNFLYFPSFLEVVIFPSVCSVSWEEFNSILTAEESACTFVVCSGNHTQLVLRVSNDSPAPAISLAKFKTSFLRSRGLRTLWFSNGIARYRSVWIREQADGDFIKNTYICEGRGPRAMVPRARAGRAGLAISNSELWAFWLINTRLWFMSSEAAISARTTIKSRTYHQRKALHGTLSK